MKEREVHFLWVVYFYAYVFVRRFSVPYIPQLLLNSTCLHCNMYFEYFITLNWLFVIRRNTYCVLSSIT